MGWPPCMSEGCDRWPSVGFTGVCNECIKDPSKVRTVADAMHRNRETWTKKDFEASIAMAWLRRESDGSTLRMVLDLMQATPGLSVDDAISLSRSHYWNTKGKAP